MPQAYTPEYHRLVLDNGLTLVIEKHPHVRTVCLGAWVKVGSSNERPSENGLAHFIEHMVFKGTKTRSALEIATTLECLGGDLNAFTDRELTCFHASVLNEHVDLGLEIISDLVRNPLFDKVQLERERKVVLQELSMIEETPDDWIGDLFFSSVWKDQPMGQTVIGSKKTIQKMTRTQVTKFFEHHYRPENMVVAVAGNVDVSAVRKTVERSFTFPISSQKQLPLSPPPPKYRSKKKAESLDTEQTHLLMGFESVGFRNPQRFDALILSFFLGGGMSSRLFQEVREKAGLAYSIDCDYVPFTDTGVFTIYAAMAPKSLKNCLSIVGKEIDRLKKRLLTNTELNLVKGQLKGTILMCADQMEVRQESLGRNEIVFNRHVPVEEVIAEIDAVTPERIQRIASKIFVPQKETIVTVGKAKPKIASLTLFD